jgi:cation transport ATPase
VSYLIATYWMWLMVALVAGALIGAWSTTRDQAGSHRFWFSVSATIAAFAVGLAAAASQWLPGREGLYLETLLMLLFCFVIGAVVARAAGQGRASVRSARRERQTGVTDGAA